MAVGRRIRRRRGEEEPAPETLDTPRSDHMAAAILSLQRSAGNRAVGSMLARTLTVRNVDFNPASNRFVDSDVPARALITQIKASALYGVPRCAMCISSPDARPPNASAGTSPALHLSSMRSAASPERRRRTGREAA
jgi:hypothetical protein